MDIHPGSAALGRECPGKGNSRGLLPLGSSDCAALGIPAPPGASRIPQGVFHPLSACTGAQASLKATAKPSNSWFPCRGTTPEFLMAGLLGEGMFPVRPSGKTEQLTRIHLPFGDCLKVKEKKLKNKNAVWFFAGISFVLPLPKHCFNSPQQPQPWKFLVWLRRSPGLGFVFQAKQDHKVFYS